MSPEQENKDRRAKVFISYSYDSTDHEAWVVNLASDLAKRGVEIVFDQWDVRLGGNLQMFMEKGLEGASRVVVICTDKYNEKSNNGKGGVGYEKTILTDEIIRDQDTHKFIPILRGVTGIAKTPKCLLGRRYLDMSDDITYESNLEKLANDILNIKNNVVSTMEETRVVIESADEPDKSIHRDIVLESTSFFDGCLDRRFPV